MYKYCVTISTINTFLLLLLNSVWLLLDLLLSSSLLTIFIIITITITIIITIIIIIIIINTVIIIVIIKITISSNLIGSIFPWSDISRVFNDKMLLLNTCYRTNE